MRCVIPDCGNDSSYTSQEIAYFSFPTEPLLLKAWVRMVQQHEGWQPGPGSAICSNHFLRHNLLVQDNEVYALRAGSLPQVTAQVCRICFATDLKLYQMAAYKILFEAYENLTGLSLQHENGLPQLVCAACARRLLNCARLRTASLRAHVMLLDILNTRGRITKRSVSSYNRDQGYDKLNIENNDDSELDLATAIDIIEKENIYNVNQPLSLRSDVASDGINVNKSCGGVFKDSDENNDMIMTYDLLKEEVSDDEHIIDCIEAEQNHLMIQDNANEYSTDSKYMNVFDGEDDLGNSQQVEGLRHTTNLSRLAAAVIEASKDLSGNKQVLTIHEKPEANGELLPDKIYSCDLCSYQSSNIVQFLNHLKTHAGKPYICDVCFYVTQRKSQLKNHVCLKVDPNNPLTCPICKKTFQRRAALAIHSKTHSDKKISFKCEMCDHFYPTKKKLNRHMKVHSNKHSCHFCNKSFQYKGNFENHMKHIHPNYNPYTYKTHDRPKKLYICEVCNKRFCSKKILISHLKSYCIGKPFSCVICKKEFGGNDILREHIAAEHF